MTTSATFLERWARKTQERRDREFYLVALPLVVSGAGVIPHLLQALIIPGADPVSPLLGQTLLGALMVGVVAYALTRLASHPRWWGATRSRWPLLAHFLLLWTPVALLVDAPQRIAELTLFVGPGYPSSRVAPYALGVALSRTFLFAGGIVFFERLVGAVNDVASERRRALTLETQVMKNLIQPHFLLNSLNAIRAYLEESPAIAEEMLLALTSLLRRVIHHSGLDNVTLDEELATVRDYFAVMNRRYEATFRLDTEGVPATPLKLPPLILFTIVENSFKHGFSGRKEGVVTLRVEQGERLRLILTDDGAGEGAHEEGGGRRRGLHRRPARTGLWRRLRLCPRPPGGGGLPDRHRNPVGESMRIVIVEDEPVAARQLVRMLEKLLGPDGGAVRHCATLAEGERALADGADLLFLDLNLAGEDGFALLRRFVGEPFETVVTTAYPERAVEAFELGVRDYLVKPFALERLSQAMGRIPRPDAEKSPAMTAVVIKGREGYESVPVARIVAVRSAGDYTELLLTGGEIRLSAKRMDFLEQRLPDAFMRIHRTAIARVSLVRELRIEAAGRYEAVVEGIAEPLPVGRSRYKELKERLGV
ncbi:MAG: histidine kinase [Nitrospinae bacterium]|nr:histidine kinase [Nitrospinota bacterium]